MVICDNDIVKITDLGSNFYLTQEMVGKVTRAEGNNNDNERQQSLTPRT